MARIVVIGLCTFVSLGALIFGMDGGYLSGVLAMPNFIEDFGRFNDRTGKYYIPAGRQSFITSFPYVGQFLAALSGGYIGDILGRRWGLFIMSVASVIGVVMQIVAKNEALFVTGRFFNYVSIGFATIFVPIYQAECSPRRIRGTMITLYQLNIVVGSFLISIVNNFTQEVKSDASYRIPIGLLLVLPVLIIPGLPFLPESPRWLMKRGREEEARKSLEIIHRGDVGFSVESEVLFLRATISEQEEINKASSWADCFKTTNRRRTLLAVLIQVMQQLTGVSFIFNYGTVFFSQIGVGGPFIIMIMTNLVNLVGTIVSFFLVDKLGRRPLLLAGSVVMFTGHIAVGIAGMKSDGNIAAQRAIVAFVLIYVFGFAASWGPLAWVITSEVSTNTLREKTQALGSASNILSSWLVTFSLPYLTNDDEAGLGPKVGFIFAVCVIAGGVYTFTWVPETSGRALEELDELFQQGVPARKFKGHEITGAAALVKLEKV
ncbi:sugar transporter [Choiromyces venosus 120613-1]|uniref:Sugar transporter n=1 Tax=Choiromyces venosus 120613-1 TaxID=1336337 RepID=A0A3N4JLD9_9PEZI|nr:sugar transporter [Choiromyces venosus 120613-1]